MEIMHGVAKGALVKGTKNGGFKFYINLAGRIMEWPKDESLTFEEAVGMIAEVEEYFGLAPEQVLFSARDAYYCADKSRALTEFREIVDRSPTLLAAVGKQRRKDEK